MNITPERAKALSGIVREYGIYNLTSYEKEEIASIVHHYAEILPKWQAVQGATVVAVVCNPGAFVKIDWTAEPVTACQPFRESDRVVQLQDGVPVGTQLIIKPAP